MARDIIVNKEVIDKIDFIYLLLKTVVVFLVSTYILTSRT